MKPNEFNLVKIIQEEDNDNLIYSIREEIIKNVFEHIDDIELENRSIKFIADCAYDSLIKLVSIEFYHHNAVINPLVGGWLPDEIIAPSPPDTWAAKQVSVVRKAKSDLIIPVSNSRSRSCRCDFTVECKCLTESEDREKEYLDMLYSTSRDSCLEESPHSSEDFLQNYFEDEEEEENADEESSPEEPVEDIKPKPCILKEGFSKIGISKRYTELPKINIPSPVTKSTVSELVHLLPIRVDATFDYNFDIPKTKEPKRA